MFLSPSLLLPQLPLLLPPPLSLAHTHLPPPPHHTTTTITTQQHQHQQLPLRPRCVAGNAPRLSNALCSSRCSARLASPTPRPATSSPRTSTCPRGPSRSGSRTRGSGPWQRQQQEAAASTTMLTMERPTTCPPQPQAQLQSQSHRPPTRRLLIRPSNSQFRSIRCLGWGWPATHSHPSRP